MEVTKTGTIITVNFPDEEVKFTANRIRVDSDNCEVVITWKIDFEDGSSRHFSLRENTKLMDSWSKEKLVRTLEERTEELAPGKFTWGSIINDGFDAIIDKHREGNAPEHMIDMSDATPRTYTIKPLFINGVANLIWARGGSSKSYFGLLFCVLVDKGMSAVGLTGRKGNALYLDWEEDVDVFKQRLRAIQSGLEIDDPNTSGIIYKKMVGSLASNVEAISKLVLDYKVNFIVIDSVSPALGGDSNSQQVVEEYFSSLRELDVTTVSIDHANKSGEMSGRFEIHGSSFKYARARMVYELRKDQESNDNTADVLWYHRKANDSKMKGARGYKITFEEEQVYNEKEDEFDDILRKVDFEQLKLGDTDNNLLKTLPAVDIVCALIEKYGSTGLEEVLSSVSAIKETDIKKSSIENAISRSKRLNLIENMVSLKQGEQEKWQI